MVETDQDRYAKAQTERQSKVDAVIQSKSQKKVVVAGPGTGKTFLFKEILKTKRNALTLTFVNSLVEDLSLDLCGLSDVKTLHAFARAVIAKATGGVKIYPKLSKIIYEDAVILEGRDIDFDFLFHTRADKNKDIVFYKRRRVLYGHYGFTDIIYAAALYLELKSEKIPRYDQILVDEFQDFNPLEVSLIDALASKSPILIAGDDDQSLYFFKDASPDHIRQRYSDENTEYISFNLPHCSRCTRVIVGAANDVVAAARREGFLEKRIDKPYKYFEDEKKEVDCKRYPKLAHVSCFATQVPYFISNAVREIAEDRREKFSVLIIAPTKSRCRKIAVSLGEKGFENVHFVDRDRNEDPTFMDAMLLLCDDIKSDLGWRIAAKFLLSAADLKALLEQKHAELHTFFDSELKTKVKHLVRTFKQIGGDKIVDASRFAELTQSLGLDVQALARETLRLKIDAAQFRSGDPAIRNIPIKITTIPSSKGLAEDYVFIADFDDRFFLEKEGKCTDQKIFDFLVAITRARKKIFLISSDAKEPKFLTWIAKDRIEKVNL